MADFWFWVAVAVIGTLIATAIILLIKNVQQRYKNQDRVNRGIIAIKEAAEVFYDEMIDHMENFETTDVFETVLAYDEKYSDIQHKYSGKICW